ncbi:MAG: DNA repair protein RecN [Eubacteriaceae bacterium]
MLFELNIKNYALIEKLNIQFNNGFNVITGETGVGKSIIVNALTMCLGSRASKDLIRKGENKMVVQAIFTIDTPSNKIMNFMNSVGVEWDENLILTREVMSTGKSIGRINGRVVNINDLKKIGSILIDIHSQREHQSLLDKINHIHILDGFVNENLNEELNSLKGVLEEYNNLKQKKEKIIKEELEIEREKDLLKFQLSDLNQFELSDEDDVNLEQQLKILSNAELIFNNSSIAYDALYSNEKSIYNNLSICIDDIVKVANIDNNIQGLLSQLKESLTIIEDVSYTLRDYKEDIQFDDIELNNINNKLSVINKLKKKYGPEIKDINKYKEYVKNRIDIIENKDEIICELDKQINIKKNKYLNIAKNISNMRKKTAKEFEEKITKLLKELAMDKAELQVRIKTDIERFTKMGIDQVEFFIKTNSGEEYKPLTKIASGGELSRIILAIKNVINTSDELYTIIFDEIDTGISGKTAQVVANNINSISKFCQVITITHLPQIASMAKTHFRVSKVSENNKTFTIFDRLKFDQRCIEIAKMTSGSEITETSIQHAREMLSIHGKNE